MAIRDLYLASLPLELAEETRVLDGERRLGGEGREELDHVGRELARPVADDGQAPEQAPLAQKGNGEHRPRAGAEQSLA